MPPQRVQAQAFEKIPSYKITDVAEAVAPGVKTEVVGIRPGEKMHEEMITSSDSFNTIDLDRYYAILPQGNSKIQKYYEDKGGKMVEPGFCYNSGTNNEWLSVDDLQKLISNHVNI